ncbi:RecT family recombinase [Oceanobacillus oncorhynchi]|uniref:RecT family recombinase n=1 Tax=Oceanobacillus oncorhynchi TaxID=545501 RepID=UPI00186941BD|nr:RecT family recombinase [Oceanobacillus oncorhynchi]
MDKKITFTQNEKALIWSRFVHPKKGTEDEADHYISYCEQFGLNPLLNDIVFNRFESKNGPVAQFIATRDGLLRLATQQSDYVGPPNAAVVKEGDEFEFLPSEGAVRHKFGSKRGKILGAYAILKHKRFNPVATFVDFDEYFQANSGVATTQKGNKNTWDKMPSAMIVKVAEVFVLKRQFPLGGIQTQEEMGLENIDQYVTEFVPNSPSSNTIVEADDNHEVTAQDKSDKSSKEEIRQTSASNTQGVASNNKTQRMKVILKSFEIKDSPSGTKYGLCEVEEMESNNPINIMVKGEEEIKVLQQLPKDSQLYVSVYKETGFLFLDYIEQSLTGNEQKPAATEDYKKEKSQSEENEQSNYQVLEGVVQKVEFGQKGKTKFSKLTFQPSEGEAMLLLAQGDKKVRQVESLPDKEEIAIKVKDENGFQFFVGVHEQDMKAG